MPDSTRSEPDAPASPLPQPQTEGKGAATVYAVTSFDRGGNAGFVVHCIFVNREDAERFELRDATRAGHCEPALAMRRFIVALYAPPTSAQGAR